MIQKQFKFHLLVVSTKTRLKLIIQNVSSLKVKLNYQANIQAPDYLCTIIVELKYFNYNNKLSNKDVFSK